MCKSYTSTQVMYEIALFSEKNYTDGKNFTRLPVMTVATNLNPWGCLGFSIVLLIIFTCQKVLLVFLLRWWFSPWCRDCGKPWRRKRANGDKIEKMAEDRLMILRSRHLFSSFGQETNGQPFYKCDNTFLPKISACQHLHISCSLVSQRIHFHKIIILTAPQYCHLQKLLCQIKIGRY